MVNEIINKIFSSLKSETKKDSLHLYKVNFTCTNLKFLNDALNEENYNLLNDALKEYDYAWDITIEELNYSVSQKKFIPIEVPNDSFVVIIELQIHKKSNCIVIFEEDIFNDSIENLDYENLLLAIKEKPFPLTFINDTGNFQKDNSVIELMNDAKKIKNISNLSNFRNHSQLSFSPDLLYLPDLGNELSIIEIKIKKLCLIYSLIYLANSSELNKNNLKISISGNKTIKYNLNIENDLDINLTQYYYDIYSWVYAESTKIEDKIEVTRNIITSYLKDDSVKINNSVFHSILSSYQIYIKGNISKYFEVRNKIIEQIEQTISKVNQSLDTFFSNFQKNLLIFISFFLSVYIYKITRNSSNSNIFNKETSLIGLYFVILSTLFLIVSIIIYRADKNRMKKRYENIKKRYQDVLIKDDIDKIINDDFEYKNEISFLEKRINWYTGLWITSIVLFVLLLFFTSDYFELSN